MENARKIWEDLGLPRIAPQPPWHGYSLGDWNDVWQRFADNAVKGDWSANGENTYARRRGGLTPETPVRNVEKSRRKE
jgi:4-hydroxy-3-polyprenylbenzoate decarboxylase